MPIYTVSVRPESDFVGILFFDWLLSFLWSTATDGSAADDSIPQDICVIGHDYTHPLLTEKKQTETDVNYAFVEIWKENRAI
jgi:hypothetical protein